jgi:hypothetical protein
MPPELLMSVAMVSVDGRLQCPVHSFDLTVGPRVTGFGHAVLDTLTLAGAVERVPTPSRLFNADSSAPKLSEGRPPH